MRRICIIIIFLQFLEKATAQQHYSKAVKEQIVRVENNLSGRIIIDGKPYNLQERMKHYNVKGISIAVIKNYKIVWAKGYGWADEKEKRLVTTETLFEPGSISKSLNAVGVLKLVQDGRLNLSSDINEYLQSWKFPYDSVSKGKKITLANLLSHTAGTTVHGFPGYDRKSKIPSIAEILDGKIPANTPAVRSVLEPGLRFQYSGGGITISQLIITDVTKKSYDQFMYDSVLKPLGMIHSFYTQPPPTSKLKILATGYTKDGTEVENKFHIYPEQAAAGLWTNPTDLSKYMIETQLAYEGKSSKVLNQAMTRLQLTPYIDNSSALGTFIQERKGVKYFFHDASNEGFTGLYFGSVEGGNGFVVVVNSEDGAIMIELLNSVAVVYDWKGFDKPVSVSTIKLPEALSRKYPGVYLYEGKIAEVTKKQDGLYYWADGQDCKMYFTSDKDFINMEFPSEKSFITDDSGNVIGYKRKVGGIEYPAATKIINVDTLKPNDGQINNFGWHLLVTKRFDEGIVYLSRGIELEPKDPSMKIILAHCYLFKNENGKAIKLYKECLDIKANDPSIKDMIKQDFDYLRKTGYDKKLIDKATKELQL